MTIARRRRGHWGGGFGGAIPPTLHIDGTQSNITAASIAGPALEFARTGVANYFDSSGVLQEAASGVGRFGAYWPNSSGVFINEGYQVEGTRTNNSAAPRDLTNAAWTATNITPVKNATGLTGDANSATTLTADANNGTITESITLLSAERTTSFWIKRITGSGTIEITDDNFTTVTDITSALSSSIYTQHFTFQTQANPVIGIRMGTSGDVIEVDCAQVEDGDIPSSPILIAGATRNRDELKITSDLSLWGPGNDITWAWRGMIPNVILSGGIDHYCFNIDDGFTTDTLNVRSDAGVGGVRRVLANSSAGGAYDEFDTGNAVADGTRFGIASSIAQDDTFISYDGVRSDEDVLPDTFNIWTDTMTKLEFGFRQAAGGDRMPLYGFMRDFKVFTSASEDAVVHALATP